MTERELMPCPFCGNQPYIAEEMDPEDWWYVACQTPGCILPIAAGYTSIESAIAKWNRRTTPDREAIIEECAKVCEELSAGFSEPGKHRTRMVAAAMQGALTCAYAIRQTKTVPNGEKG